MKFLVGSTEFLWQLVYRHAPLKGTCYAERPSFEQWVEASKSDNLSVIYSLLDHKVNDISSNVMGKSHDLLDMTVHKDLSFL